MPERANRLKSEKTAESPKKTKKKSSSFFSLKESVRSFFNSERTHKISGMAILLFSIFMFISFTSYLFTWKADNDSFSDLTLFGFLFDQDIEVNNWLGKIGAVLSHVFIHRWFGISSFIIAFLAFITGVRLITQISILPLRKTFAYSVLAIIWISVSLAYAFNSSHEIFGGSFGFFINGWLKGLLGIAGTGFLLLFVPLVFAVAVYNISFRFPRAGNPESTDENEAEQEQKNEVVSNEIALDLDTNEDIDLANENQENDIAEVSPEIDETESIDLSASIDPLSINIDDNSNNVPLTVETPQEENNPPESIDETLVKIQGPYDPTLDLSSYKKPPLDLLENFGNAKLSVNKEELESNKNKIVETLGHYNIGIDRIKAIIGPTVTLYEIVPAAGVRISKIKNLEDDIALSLSALGIRIIAPIPGKGTIGIEVPNQKPEMVSMHSIISSDKFQNTEFDLPIGLGKTIANEVFIADLTRMPHLLMAGATGQGKSVGLNAILASLLYKKHPSQVKFILVDPKKVELTLFKKIERHFLAKLPGEEEAIITDTTKVIHTLNSLCIEMAQRYDLLKDAQVRNIKEYNAKFVARKLNPNEGHKFLPYIVLVVDEFADLIMTAGKEIETPMTRLAQLARAIGIHLIIATQRPSVNIITGTIKANFPARLAFRVISKIDSRTILDAGGADQLVGRGDMLLSTGAELIRLQCAFVDTPDVEKITDFIGSQRGYPEAHLLPEYVDETASATGDYNSGENDQLFEEAARIVVQHQQGSASLLQRRLKLGYNRAGRIVDQLEAAGIIGPFEGSKAREVLIKDSLSLEQFLVKLKGE